MHLVCRRNKAMACPHSDFLAHFLCSRIPSILSQILCNSCNSIRKKLRLLPPAILLPSIFRQVLFKPKLVISRKSCNKILSHWHPVQVLFQRSFNCRKPPRKVSISMRWCYPLNRRTTTSMQKPICNFQTGKAFRPLK